MRALWRLVFLSSWSSASVVIGGETGTGEELIARALHRFSPRRSGPFVAINCAALPPTLLESELFGHEKGAFTGATARHQGRFELAHGGTLFLDEIGDLPLELQVKLLRVLQERTFERIGGTETTSVDVRIVAATHRDLESDVRSGRFRSDLFYRLNVLSIHAPPLRDRRGDIARLWSHFVHDIADAERRPAPRTTSAALEALERYEWPGNVRELHNVAQQAVTLTTTGAVDLVALPETPRVSSRGQTELGLAGLTFKAIERAAILESYEAYGTVKATARALGISPRKVHYRLRQYREENEAAQGLRAPGAGPARPSAARIAVAEDDDELRWALAGYLESSGYEVLAVSDGTALLEHLAEVCQLERREAAPDLIVTDFRMPRLNGLQLLERVRSRGWNMPVVLISAFGDDVSRSDADALGATAFLDKPIDVAQLRSIIEHTVVH